MTYKEIINRIRTVAQDHLMIKDFGYGELSDIKTQAQFGPGGNIDDGKEADYPYMFLLPAGSTRNDPVVNYNFSMIMMDMARGEEGDDYDNYLTIQSQCQQYIDDCLAQLYYYYKDQPMVQLTGITYTPFKEAYQDEVAGMTANFTIQVPNGLNDCIAPFSNLVEQWGYDGIQYLGGLTQDANGNTAPIPANAFPPGPGFFTINQPIIINPTPYWSAGGGPGSSGSFNLNAVNNQDKITSWALEFDMTYNWDPQPYNIANGDPYDQDPQNFYYVGNPNGGSGPEDPIQISNKPNYNATIAGFPYASAVPGQKYSVRFEWINDNQNTIGNGTSMFLQQNRYTFPLGPSPALEFLNWTQQLKIENLKLSIFGTN